MGTWFLFVFEIDVVFRTMVQPKLRASFIGTKIAKTRELIIILRHPPVKTLTQALMFVLFDVFQHENIHMRVNC